MMVELSMSRGLHVLKDLGHADWRIPQFLGLILLLLLLSVVGGGLGIGVGVGHDEVLLGVEAGLVDVVDVGDRLGDLGTSVSKDHWLAVRMILVLVLIGGMIGLLILIVIASSMTLEHGIIRGSA